MMQSIAFTIVPLKKYNTSVIKVYCDCDSSLSAAECAVSELKNKMLLIKNKIKLRNDLRGYVNSSRGWL